MNEFNPQPKIKREKRKIVKQGKLVKPKKKEKKKSHKSVRNLCLQKAQRNCKIRWQVEHHNTSGLVECISCGAMIPIEKIQGGHFISRQNRATEVLKENIHPQCATCNVLKRGNYLAYEYRMRGFYGDAYVDRIKNMALAKNGVEEAILKLSDADIKYLNEKHTSKWYMAECDRLDSEYNTLTEILDRMIEGK